MEFSWWLVQRKFQVLWVMKVDKKPLKIDALNNIFWNFILTGLNFEVWNEIFPQNSHLKSVLLQNYQWILIDSKIFSVYNTFLVLWSLNHWISIDAMEVQKISNFSDVSFEEEYRSKLEKPGFYQRHSFKMQN